ncbi:hypothetical protein Pan1_102 [Pseudanabaena phage Pan1]|nr:hypothetical protein Pan1_102 [Pseudanabaena phage Pan1]
MIGVGVTPSLSGALGLINGTKPDDVVLVTSDGRQITRDLVKILVRYRVAAKAPQFTPRPCSNGRAYCLRSTQ